MQPVEDRAEVQLLSHLDAAYNLARWLVRDTHDAEDIVQEAYMRAYKRFLTFRGGDGRAWLLTIVRNCAYDLLRSNGTVIYGDAFDEEGYIARAPSSCDPEAALLRDEKAEQVRSALENLLPQYREVLILREMEELSYSEIATTLGVPLGTVMSRLSRARIRLHQNLTAPVGVALTHQPDTSSPNIRKEC
jgi:RNA polymerase sigma-70 factor (ECF subfamily)